MSEQNSQTTTVEVTEEQRQIVLGALTEKLLDAERYLFGSGVDDEPGVLDRCCTAHLARYERNKEIHRALKEQKRAVQAMITLFSAGHAPEH